MHVFRLDVAGAVFNFAGAVLLAKDALLARRAVSVRRGRKTLLDASRHSGKDVVFTSTSGDPLSTPEALEDLSAEETSKDALWGFSLVALGFALDLISKLLATTTH